MDAVHNIYRMNRADLRTSDYIRVSIDVFTDTRPAKAAN
jgi:hypothetical protein